MKSVTIKKIGRSLSGELSFPGDKSLTHRAIVFGSLADGKSSFTNMLPAEDCVFMRKAFQAMGVPIEVLSPTNLCIAGRGLRSLKAPSKELYLGNSGTAMRLLLGVLAGQDFKVTLTGDESLSSRPMSRVTDYLRKMGATFEGKDNGNFAPITVEARRALPLQSIDVKLPIPSAQVKSAILLAGLYAKGETSVKEPVKSRDHTERFLSHFGVSIKEEGLKVSLSGGQSLKPRSFEIAGDISSAAFFMALALLTPESRLKFCSVLWNPTRLGFLEVLKRMGVWVEPERFYEMGPESAADFFLKRHSGLKAFEIKKEELPSLIDEIPILMVLATQAKGVSVIRDAEELRVKETDRIHSMSTQLVRMGAKVRVQGHTIFIEGPTPLCGSEVDSFKDHRTAMSLVIAGLAAEGETRVKDLDCVATSFPNFFDLLKHVGVDSLTPLT
jgi:3-phosphoshikimate 1-carboxyvinyltransferase